MDGTGSYLPGVIDGGEGSSRWAASRAPAGYSRHEEGAPETEEEGTPEVKAEGASGRGGGGGHGLDEGRCGDGLEGENEAVGGMVSTVVVGKVEAAATDLGREAAATDLGR